MEISVFKIKMWECDYFKYEMKKGLFEQIMPITTDWLKSMESNCLSQNNQISPTMF